MISPETIDRIRDAMRIEEVVGEFVNLRKRGANFIGLCPFHNEKTPSFNVHPVKGIFKCFGCGEGGNPIDFLIKHEQLNYVEALKWLAKKYNIEIVEEQMTEEQSAAHALRERLFNLNKFAVSWYQEQLKSNDEGRAVALAYCRNRGISDESIEKFLIGYSPADNEAFASHALKNGYDKDLLTNGGLCIIKNGNLTDRFKGRLIFPIHNISGNVLGFGGRIMHQETKLPKYVNSPETEVYQKNKTLYGIFQGRTAIAKADNCYLVEGYTDVISLHQAGVSNVVASSGTSLTVEQIRLIRRYTNNVTIIFDGDTAGIKASFRGIDMILQEGLHVRIIPMPEGDDPDSFAKKHRASEVEEYFKLNNENFITFKAALLKRDAGNDPVKLGSLIRELISSVAMVPDPLMRSLYVKQCAEITGMEEEQLVFELNRQLREKNISKIKSSARDIIPEPTRIAPKQVIDKEQKPLTEYQEDDIIRILLNYGDHQIALSNEDDKSNEKISVAKEITKELVADEIVFDNPLWEKIFNHYRKAEVSDEPMPEQFFFINNDDPEIRAVTIDLISFPYTLSDNWEKRRIHVHPESELLDKVVDEALNSFRLRKIEEMMQNIQAQIPNTDNEDESYALVKKYHRLLLVRKELANVLGRTITH